MLVNSLLPDSLSYSSFSTSSGRPGQHSLPNMPYLKGQHLPLPGILFIKILNKPLQSHTRGLYFLSTLHLVVCAISHQSLIGSAINSIT